MKIDPDKAEGRLNLIWSIFMIIFLLSIIAAVGQDVLWPIFVGGAIMLFGLLFGGAWALGEFD